MENPLATAVGTATSFFNAREDNKRQADAAARKQADDDREFKRQQSLTDAQIANYQSLGSEREAKVQQIAAVLPYLPMEMRAKVASLIGKGDLEGAQAALTTAKIPETQAQTGLIKAKTTTEAQRPALIKAQTKNVNDLPESRAQALQEKYWQAKTASDTALAKGQMAVAAAQARQAASIAAAFDRFELGKLLFPIAQHVGLDAAEFAHLADGEVPLAGDRRQFAVIAWFQHTPRRGPLTSGQDGM